MKEYFVKIGNKEVKLWQDDAGNWQADGGLDPAGFTYDPDLPEEQRVYELDYLIAHGNGTEMRAQDLIKQFAYLKSTSPETYYPQLNSLAQKISAGLVNPDETNLADLEKTLLPSAPATTPTPPPPTTSQSKIIDQDILQVLGLSHLDYNEKKELVEQFSTTIFQAVFLRAAAKMPKERREEFIKVLEKNNEEQIGAFLKA
ncbi:MAG: hypothetical protein M1338_00960, partial [Patescibacteria group bacterium]|nr:hypothetical protein [Patescibacteria group bacterium]